MQTIYIISDFSLILAKKISKKKNIRTKPSKIVFLIFQLSSSALKILHSNASGGYALYKILFSSLEFDKKIKRNYLITSVKISRNLKIRASY